MPLPVETGTAKEEHHRCVQILGMQHQSCQGGDIVFLDLAGCSLMPSRGKPEFRSSAVVDDGQRPR